LNKFVYFSFLILAINIFTTMIWNDGPYSWSYEFCWNWKLDYVQIATLFQSLFYCPSLFWRTKKFGSSAILKGHVPYFAHNKGKTRQQRKRRSKAREVHLVINCCYLR
jgi:hypothetical protein